MKNKALGRGLKSLIPDVPLNAPARRSSVTFLKVGEIKVNPYQPRDAIDPLRLQQLADSIRAKGLIQPIVVRRAQNGYELIAGERRLRAVQLLGHDDVPALVREQMSDRESLELALLENVQRDDLNPVEEARGYQRLAGEFGLTQETIAHAVGKDRSTIANALRLLKLPALMLDAIRANQLTMGHAKALLAVEDARQQQRLFDDLLARGGSVRQTETKVARLSPRRSGRRPSDPAVATVEEELARALGTRVRIHHGRRRGRVVIEYYSLDDLERIRHVINGQRLTV